MTGGCSVVAACSFSPWMGHGHVDTHTKERFECNTKTINNQQSHKKVGGVESVGGV